MFDILDMGASGLEVQRARMDVAAENTANATTLFNTQGQNVPYRRRFTMIAPGRAGDPSKPGVHLVKIAEDQAPFPSKYVGLGVPGADKYGYLKYSNVDTTVETVCGMEASRAYEANVSMMETAKAMIASDLRLLA